jgi:membrane carboxypeptidase/penicillin-binding protein
MRSLYDLPRLAERLSVKRLLVRVHGDLLEVERHISPYVAYYPSELTEFELVVLALEDRRFFRHVGVDVASVLRELFRALTFRKHGGASTIDMQFVRTATGYVSKSIRRKLYEMLLSLVIQYRHNKVVILRSYLKCAFFGSHLYGVERAALALFAKSPEQLTLEEGAYLASMLVYPKPLRPSSRWHLAVERRAKYGMSIYVSHKERLKKLPSSKVV